MRHTLTILGLLMIFCASAQDSLRGKVTGTVVTATDKKGLGNATVTVTAKGKAGKPTTSVTTVKGDFELNIRDTGLHLFAISHTGYKEQLLSVHISKGFTGWHLGTISLQPGEGVLPEVIIRTDRPLVEQKADRLVYNAEKDLSTLGGTAADVLRNVPMLSVDGDGNVQLRGSSNIRVLVNNRPSSIIAASVADALRQMPADMVKSVEVITSPSAKYDAEGTAGVINIITKKNLLQGVTGSVSIIPGNVSTIGDAGLNFRRKNYGLRFSSQINQFYNHGTTYLERRSYLNQSVYTQRGETRNRSGFVSPRIGFDVNLDDRNSLMGGFGYNPGHNQVKNNQVITNTMPGQSPVITNMYLLNRTTQTGYDYNLDYLRTFKDPQKEFSILSQYSVTHSHNIANQDESDLSKQPVYYQRNTNKSYNKEATFQADYTQPFKNKSTLETGAKTILREAGSDVKYKDIFPSSSTEISAENIFSYTQNVWSAYGLYGFKLFKKINAKLGARYENTEVDADFKTRDLQFRSAYGNLIPSVNASYTFKEKHSFRFGYTQRIQRPQLYFLNPYREVVSPKVIRQGNPGLDAELAHLLEVGYGFYGTGFSFNTSLFTRNTNNAISTVLELRNDTTYMYYLNIASNRTSGLNLSGNVKPFKRWSLNGNFNLYHIDLTGNGVSNEGWMYSFFAGSFLELGKGWVHQFTGSFSSRRVTLQGRMAQFYWHNTTIRKDIWKKRGSIGINLANPFMKGTKVKNDIVTPTFEQHDDNINYTRGIRLAFQYRFGTLQQAKTPRKAKKAINNDDALRG